MNRINLICLGVRNMEKSLQFYKDIGFKTYEKNSNPPIVFFDNQGTKLELYPIAGLASDINEKNPPPLTLGGFCGITLAINLKSAAEVDQLMETVAAADGIIAKKPAKFFGVAIADIFQDPDGYYWEVAYSADWQFDHNDMLVIDENN